MKIPFISTDDIGDVAVQYLLDTPWQDIGNIILWGGKHNLRSGGSKIIGTLTLRRCSSKQRISWRSKVIYEKTSAVMGVGFYHEAHG